MSEILTRALGHVAQGDPDSPNAPELVREGVAAVRREFAALRERVEYAESTVRTQDLIAVEARKERDALRARVAELERLIESAPHWDYWSGSGSA